MSATPAPTCHYCLTKLRVVDTAYGQRAACACKGIRWTRINGEEHWTAEKS